MSDVLQRIANHLPLTCDDIAWVYSADPIELDQLIEQLSGSMLDGAGIESLCLSLAGRVRQGDSSWNGAVPMSNLYDVLPPDHPARGAILHYLLEDGSDAAMTEACERLLRDPPQRTESVAQGLSVLFREPARARQALELVDRCWDALEHIHVASPLLDLMNYLCRKHAMDHPATKRSGQLRALLGAVVQRLEQLAKQPPTEAQAAETHRAMVEEGVPLCVSLCDAMALIGDGVAQATLHQALTLPHRRIRTEAAWALAKLGEELGKQTLLEQIADPYTRLRVVEYCQELELLDQVAPHYLSDESNAEAALCAWLADPAQFGLPPLEMKLVDQRRLYWPGYDDEQPCYLFQFTYRLPQGELNNVGIAGPVEHAFATDLTCLPRDDVFAMFAGWHADHDEMEDAIPEQLSPSGRIEMERLVRRLKDCGYDDIEPSLFCQFFGELALVAQATHRNTPGTPRGWAVVDAIDDFWLPSMPRFGPVEAGYVYKGRRLLRAFNEDEVVGDHADESS